jgi:hypothetical protein
MLEKSMAKPKQVNEGYQPTPNKLERGYQPAPGKGSNAGNSPPAGLGSNIQHPVKADPSPKK